MSDEQLNNFAPKAPVSLRAVDAAWVADRATATGVTPLEVIQEVANGLVERLNHNMDATRDVLLYSPENEDGPYILALPLKWESSKTKKQSAEAKPLPKSFINSDADNNKIVKEFETLIRKKYPGLDDFVFVRNQLGIYLDPKIKDLWDGFWLYHESQTTVSDTVNKKMYEKSLGRFILGKIVASGSVMFPTAPYRHATRQGATEEALRLSGTYGCSFAIYRAVDVVGE